MRIIAFSDVHRQTGKLFEIIEKHPEADLFLNCGDSAEEVDDVQTFHRNIKIRSVCGNCDWNCSFPNELLFDFAGKKFFAAHGHTYCVKHGLERIKKRAAQLGADICVFGHTHIPMCRRENDVFYFNPGAVLDGVYGIIDIVDSQIICINAKL